MNIKRLLPALLCGLLSAAADFWLIPTFFMRGIPDFIWISLMVCAPAIIAACLLRNQAPSSVLWSALIQCLLVTLFANSLGTMLGYQLGNIANDFFDYIGYLIFVLGWIAAATFVQFLTLLFVRKLNT